MQQGKIFAITTITNRRHRRRQWHPTPVLLGKKVMANPDSIFETRDITLPTKVRLVKVMVFPVVMYGCECWTVKKAECQRIDAFELWFWRRLLRVPCTARRSWEALWREDINGLVLTILIFLYYFLVNILSKVWF